MRKIFIFLLCLLFFSCSQNNCEEAQLWDYPVKPGMEEWKQFHSNKEMVAACQIPEKILCCLSTEKLTDLCLQYPLLSDFYAFNFPDDGLDILFKDFNGIRELYKKNNVADFLIKRYKEKIQMLSFLEDETIDSYKRSSFMISVTNLDALLSRVEQQDNLKEILRNLVIGYEAISMLDSYAKNLMLRFNFFSRAHVIVKMHDEYRKEISNAFSAGGADSETADSINKLSYQLIK